MTHIMKDQRARIFEKVRAAKCYISTAGGVERAARLEMAAFLDAFHPDLDDDVVLDLIDDAGRSAMAATHNH